MTKKINLIYKPNDVIKTNKLIAEFMNERKRNLELDNRKSGYHYHESWDWLMPVIEKLFATETSGNMYKRLNDALITLNINEIYDEVVAFIRRYYKNKPKGEADYDPSEKEDSYPNRGTNLPPNTDID